MEGADPRGTRGELLSEVKRSAPLQAGGVLAQFHSWSFDYSSNGGVVTWDPAGADLPSTMKGVYVDFYVNTSVATAAATTQQDRFLARSYPADSRSATKLLDFDGNGTLDAIYHPAGIARPDAPVNTVQSYLQSPSATWQSVGPAPATGMLSHAFTEFLDLDLDRDSDLDALAFPSTTFNLDDAVVVEPGQTNNPSAFHGFCTGVANSCCNSALSCGELMTPLLECSGGTCPDVEGARSVIYPPDSVANIVNDRPFSVTNSGGTVAASGGAFCGAGRGICNAYYNASQFEYCRTPANACASDGDRERNPNSVQIHEHAPGRTDAATVGGSRGAGTPLTNTNHKNGKTYFNGNAEKGTPVTAEQVKNIVEGTATKSAPKNRGQ